MGEFASCLLQHSILLELWEAGNNFINENRDEKATKQFLSFINRFLLLYPESLLMTLPNPSLTNAKSGSHSSFSVSFPLPVQSQEISSPWCPLLPSSVFHSNCNDSSSSPHCLSVVVICFQPPFPSSYNSYTPSSLWRTNCLATLSSRAQGRSVT